MPTDDSTRAEGDATRARPEPEAPAEPTQEPIRRKGDIPTDLLDPHALTVVRRLARFGHEAYLVGGCVRDLLAGLEPKDFDVVTDARPNRIKRLFRNARIIGRRFRLAHIRFGPDHIVETSTFRADPGAPNGDDGDENGEERAPGGYVADDRPNLTGTSENVFGTAPEDARRRDFTINALFYDPLEDEILDWVGGLQDLEDGVVRSIGDPRRRIVEDPVRMIRAVHFAARMGFRLEPMLEDAIRDLAAELEHASPARLYIELLKILNRGRARRTLERLHELGVLTYWLPELTGELDAEPTTRPEDGHHHEFHDDPPVGEATWNLLEAGDRWGMARHRAADALALAPLLGPWILERWRREGARRGYAAFADCYDATVRPMALRMSMPRRTIGRLRELVWMWLELRRPPHPNRARRTVTRPAFPHTLAFLRLDLEARGASDDVLRQWEARQPEWNSREADRGRRETRERSELRGRGRGRGRRDRRDDERPSRGRDEGRRGRRTRRAGIRREADAFTPAPPREEAAPRRPEPPSPEREARPDPKPPESPDTFAEGLE